MTKLRSDAVHRALSDPNRRRMLELLARRPGINASQLSEKFPFSRIAVVKHLAVLERCGLLRRERDGRSMALFAETAPIAETCNDALAKFAPFWTERLISLKDRLEGRASPMPDAAPRHVYVVYIRTTVQALWEALTTPEGTRRFYYGTSVKSRFEVGATIEYALTDPTGAERVPVSGKILEFVPQKRLVHTFRFPSGADAESRVAYEIEPAGAGTVKLTITHDGFAGETKTYREVGGGWPQIVSGLKTWLETGRELDID